MRLQLQLSIPSTTHASSVRTRVAGATPGGRHHSRHRSRHHGAPARGCDAGSGPGCGCGCRAGAGHGCGCGCDGAHGCRGGAGRGSCCGSCCGTCCAPGGPGCGCGSCCGARPRGRRCGRASGRASGSGRGSGSGPAWVGRRPRWAAAAERRHAACWQAPASPASAASADAIGSCRRYSGVWRGAQTRRTGRAAQPPCSPGPPPPLASARHARVTEIGQTLYLQALGESAGLPMVCRAV